MTATLADLTDPNAPTPYKAPTNPNAYTPNAPSNAYTPTAPANTYTPAAPTNTYTPPPNTYVDPSASGLAGGQGGASTQPTSAPNVPAPIPLAQPTSTPDPLAFAPPISEASPPPPTVAPDTSAAAIPLAPAPAASPTLSPSTPPDATPQGPQAPAATAAPIISGATEAARTPETGGVTEYGKVWVPGSEPPAGLDSTAYQEWQQNNPLDVGWSQSGWDFLHQAAAIDGSTDAGQQQLSDLVGKQTANPGPIPTQDQANYASGGSAAGGATNAPGVQPIIPPGTTSVTPPPIQQFTPTPITTPTIPTAATAPSVPTGGISGTDANGLPIPTSGGNSSYSLTPTTTDNSLVNSTITPGAGVDRFAIAKSRLADFTANEALQYKADLDQANRYGAASGVEGSGQLNTTYGNIADTHARSLQSEQDTVFNDALEGSIADAYQDINIAQQQQGFQATQQQTAFAQQMAVQTLMDSEQGQQWAEQLQAAGFNAEQIQQAFQNAVTTQQLSDSENAQQFYQAYEQYVAGTSGNPVDFETWYAAQLGKKAA